MNTSLNENENALVAETKIKPHDQSPKCKTRMPLRVFTPLSKPEFQPDIIDTVNLSDPQFLGEYAAEIYHNLYVYEDLASFNPDYIKNQPGLSYKMRAILIDWLVSVHLKFKLLTETLYLTVNYIDRYLEKRPVPKSNLQLVGATALFISCKYEEIIPVTVDDFVIITDKTYTRDQILVMERDMLAALDFNLTVVTTWRFLERLEMVAELDMKMSFFVRYLCELALVEYHMLKYKASMIAASAVYLCQKLHKIDPSWSARLVSCSRYNESELRACAKDLLILFQAAPKHSLVGVREKYSKSSFFEVAKLKII
ncbi:unnamed protein product [Blepharisma stoltei]|uniref:Cyclin N-terminal domain-containing protein n=1 Tax=Blepharisma stoltei TaxID=1481888 RepID=A0AAU9JPP1_9CILI|nr:unnamed protein product [Blepharisma stoltei]